MHFEPYSLSVMPDDLYGMCKYANRHSQLDSTQRAERVANNRTSNGRGNIPCKIEGMVQQAREASRIRCWQLL